MLFAKVPFTLTTCPNHLSFLLTISSSVSYVVCQGSLHSHHLSKPSKLPLNNLQQCVMLFAKVPFTLTTCPNHLSFLLTISSSVSYVVCQGSLHSHHMSKPSKLPLNNLQQCVICCLPRFPSPSPHVQTI